FNADAEPTKEAELKPIAISKSKNYYSVGESIDPNDWEKGLNADSVYSRVIRQYEANPSKGIILLHDAGGNRQATVDALPRIIHYYKNKGVEFTTVAGLLHISDNVIMPVGSNGLVKIDRRIAGFGYWFEHFITAAFWAAIILGLVRILLMGVMALLQKIQSRKSKDVATIALVEMPPVSIIVPAYNEEMNAAKTIENLLQLDYPNFDIIFVDDGSTDNTYAKSLKTFIDNPKVKVFTKPNGGKASALNYGIAQSGNEYVICIDADTLLKRDAVLKLMEKFVPNKLHRDQV